MSRWWATAKGGALFLAQQPATSNNKFVPMVTLPLAGCSVDVPTEGLRGKTKCAPDCRCQVSKDDPVYRLHMRS